MVDLAPDVARRQRADRRRLVPEGPATTGYVLTVVGESPFGYDWRQPPDPEIPYYPNTPDGELAAPVDSLVRNTADHSLWINTDGDTAWTRVGSSATGSTVITDTMASNDTAIGITSTRTAGETLAFGDPVYMKSDGKVWKADANGSATFPAVGLAVSGAAANATVTVLHFGTARHDAWAWTVGGLVFLSTSAGLTQTAPTATDDVIQIIGIGYPNADTLYVSPELTYLTHL